MADSKSLFVRWVDKTQIERDREFYLIALPITVIVTGITPHIIHFIISPWSFTELLRTTTITLGSAILIALVTYSLTRYLSRKKIWSEKRYEWNMILHILILWIPISILVDTPHRVAELMIVSDYNKDILSSLPYTLGISISRTFFFAGGIVFFERLISTIIEVRKEKEASIALKSQLMRNLIQPHFLLNSLNIVRAYIDESPQIAKEMVTSITELLRNVIDYSFLDRIELSRELDVIKDYIRIMNIRYESNFRLEIDKVDRLNITIPPLILFSLVENSFKHGFHPKREGLIKISVELGQRIRFWLKMMGSGKKRKNRILIRSRALVMSLSPQGSI